MVIRSLSKHPPLTTKDGSTIRSLLDLANAPVQNQSLAEATIPASSATERHCHRLSEEFYFILEGTADMEIDGNTLTVSPGDALLIPPDAWHQITASSEAPVRLLCCCALLTPTKKPCAANDRSE